MNDRAPTHDQPPSDHIIRDLVIVACVTLLSLLPFVAKPFHIDDPLFVWSAKNIQQQPLSPVNSRVNWFGTEMPMSEVMRNPPLTSYYIACAASIFGWSEIALHVAFLFPALAAVLGSYVLARRYTRLPLLAAFGASISPVFILSATSVMSDVLMFALAIWGVLAWCSGLRTLNRLFLLSALILLSAAIMAKLLAVAVVPFLLAWSWRLERRIDWRSGLLLLPLIPLFIFLFNSSNVPGNGSMMTALMNATTATASASFRLSRIAVTFLFLGGGFIGFLFYMPLLASRTVWIAILAVIGAAAIVSSTGAVSSIVLQHVDLANPVNCLHLLLFLVPGITILYLAIDELRKKPEFDTLLLSAWTILLIGFVMCLSWSVSGRYLLPVMPAAGILLARRVERRWSGNRSVRVYLPLIPSLVLVGFLAWSDYTLAVSARDAAATISKMPRPGRSTIWFEGHWGFQYYMELCGGKALDMQYTVLSEGDRVVIPANNTNTAPLDRVWVAEEEIVDLNKGGYGTVLSQTVGAGFYAHLLGPFPFYIGKVPPERYYIYTIREPAGQ